MRAFSCSKAFGEAFIETMQSRASTRTAHANRATNGVKDLTTFRLQIGEKGTCLKRKLGPAESWFTLRCGSETEYIIQPCSN